MRYQTRLLACPDCERLFPFSAEEQRLGNELGYEAPKRCRSCRRSVEVARRLLGSAYPVPA